ncbi:MAG TPA: diguanylate cyclase [Steroidobacteraceae bacterium]|jgi:two-component system cell cycle response regulator|nr:diguanylate cyclase [Steroidobacteraceae bacterium]
MGSGGHTTVIRRVLERRAQKIPAADDSTTTATVAVMVRVLPPPKALLVFVDQPLRQQMERHFTPDVLDLEAVADEAEALRRFTAEFRAVVITDSPELIRTLRARTSGGRAPFILYVAELDEAQEREVGLLAGADDCIGRRVSSDELDARVAAARRITELEGVLRITLAENRKLAATDDLTRVASRRFFGKHFPREVERAARYGLPLSLLLCDIDHFKKINDTLGHAGGDQILRQFGPRLKQGLRRRIDWVARLGGEEFAIVMPETNYAQGLEVARKLRRVVGDGPFLVDKKKVRVSASFGLCGIDRVPVRESRLAARILRIADAALYRSKHDGRNRVTATTLEGSAT